MGVGQTLRKKSLPVLYLHITSLRRQVGEMSNGILEPIVKMTKLLLFLGGGRGGSILRHGSARIVIHQVDLSFILIDISCLCVLESY